MQKSIINLSIFSSFVFDELSSIKSFENNFSGFLFLKKKHQIENKTKEVRLALFMLFDWFLLILVDFDLIERRFDNLDESVQEDVLDQFLLEQVKENKEFLMLDLKQINGNSKIFF